MKKQEYLPLVNEEGKVTGKAPRSVCHNGKSMLLHPVVHLHIFNTQGKLFLQKRSANKDVQPGRWDTSVGGHVDPGENIEEALLREAFEEAGLSDFNHLYLTKYVWESEVERELVHSFTCITPKVPVTDPEEIDEGRFWSAEEIEAALGTGIFTPNFENEYKILKAKNVFDQ